MKKKIKNREKVKKKKKGWLNLPAQENEDKLL